MKIEITKRWYLYLLISTLAITTYLDLHEIFFHRESKFPIVVFTFLGIELLLVVYIWYALIKEDSKLKIAIIIWASFNLLLTVLADLVRLLREAHPHRTSYNAHIIAVFLLILIIFIKNIRINQESDENISN